MCPSWSLKTYSTLENASSESKVPTPGCLSQLADAFFKGS